MRDLKIIFRNLFRQKLNSGIIIVSIAMGLACFNFIILFINRELKTDHFQKYGDRIFALKCDDPWLPGRKMYHCRYGSAEYLKDNFAAVEDFCRINNASVQKITADSAEYFDRPGIISASGNFFNFFSYNLLTKNPESALSAMNDLVISKDLAEKYFGSVEAVGQVIRLINRNKEEQMVVTGIFEKPKDNTQINFDMVRLIGEADSRCYIRLKSGSEMENVEKLMADNHLTIPIINTGTPGYYYLEPFHAAYFDLSRGSTVEASRDKNDLWIALIVGLMIIAIASFNYLGLLNNNIAVRNKDFVIRRVNGSTKKALVADLMVENSILVFISFILSLFLMQETLPFFNELTKGNLTKDFMFESGNIFILTAIFSLMLIVTLIFIVARMKGNLNIYTLKPDLTNKVSRFQLPAFNIFQLSCSVILIISSITIVKQMNYIAGKPIGIDKDVIEIKLPDQYADKATVFKEELLKYNSISRISVTNASPVLEHFLVLLKYTDGGEEKQYSPAGFTGDENYIPTLGLKLVRGEGFSDNIQADRKKCLINQSFAKLFPDRDLIGNGIPGMEDMTIIGIVDDFNYSDLKSMIEPAFISFDDKGGHLMVRPAENQNAQARESISLVWDKLIPDYPVNIESVGERYKWMHKNNKNYIRLIGVCSLISIFLSMIGLFSVSLQNSRLRIREIGIRKINGAGIGEMIRLLNKDFLIWVMVSSIIAFPVSWYSLNKWLESYAYKTRLSWWVFALAAVVTLVTALITVTWQSWKAAVRNPVETLRYE
jgi:putative ABC transport system permease protein